MAWHTERWVKVPVMEDAEFLALPWQARGVYRLLATKFNREGAIKVGSLGKQGLATLLGADWGEIEKYVEMLFEMQFLRIENGRIFDVRFIERERELEKGSEISGPKAHREREERERSENKKPRGRPPADPRIRPLSLRLEEIFLRVRGERYSHGGAKDTQALKGMLALASEDEIAARWTVALRAQSWIRCSTFAQLKGKWNDIGNVTPLHKPAPRTVVHFNPETNELTYSDGTKEIAK
jgi:hypothetical protein